MEWSAKALWEELQLQARSSVGRDWSVCQASQKMQTIPMNACLGKEKNNRNQNSRSPLHWTKMFWLTIFNLLSASLIFLWTYFSSLSLNKFHFWLQKKMCFLVSACALNWPYTTAFCTQILGGESWSPRSDDTTKNTGDTTISAHIPAPRKTGPELSGHRNRDLLTLILLEKAHLPGMMTHLKAKKRPPLLLWGNGT